MNKDELTTEVSVKIGVSKKVVQAILDKTLASIIDQVSEGQKVAIPKFGIFEKRYRGSRIGRHPLTGHTLQIPGQTIPTFRAGKNFRYRVMQEK